MSNLLRNPNEDKLLKAVKLQGYVDGVDFVMKDVDRILTEKEQTNPSY